MKPARLGIPAIVIALMLTMTACTAFASPTKVDGKTCGQWVQNLATANVGVAHATKDLGADLGGADLYSFVSLQNLASGAYAASDALSAAANNYSQLAKVTVPGYSRKAASAAASLSRSASSLIAFAKSVDTEVSAGPSRSDVKSLEMLLATSTSTVATAVGNEQLAKREFQKLNGFVCS